MKLFSIAGNFIRNNKTLGYALGAVLVSLLLNIRTCNKNRALRKEVAVANHNINALNDTVRVTKDKVGKVEFEKLAFLTDKISSLEKLSADLAAEVKKIKGKVSTIIQGDVVVVHDTVPLVVHASLVDSNVRAYFDYSKNFSTGNYRKLGGYTNYNLKTKITTGLLTTDEFGIRMTTGIKNLDKGKPEIFFKSDYPGLSVTGLEGAVLDPKLFSNKRPPLVVPTIGIGWSPVSYDVGKQSLQINPSQFSVQVGIGLNLIRIFKR